MAEIKSRITFKLLVFIQAAFVAALFVQFSVKAWIEPTTSPPGGNIAAPLNTGSDLQAKNGGGLNIYGNTFGVDGRGTSFGVLGYENDTGVYGYLGTGGWGGWFSGPVYSTSYIQAPMICIGAVCQSSWPSSVETLQTVTNRGWTTTQPLYTSNYAQAPIFYDANNSVYYVDPAGTSNVNAQTSNTLSTGYLDFRYAGGDSGRGNHAYAIFQEGGSWSHPYPDLRIAYHTGIKLGAHASYNGIRFYNDYDMSGLVMSVNDSATGGANNVYIPNLAYITDLRNQYMYDWNDTNYYIDMNGSSRFNYMGRNYGWNWTEYDWNNTGYYMDLNNTSRLNYGVFDNAYSYGWMQAQIFYDNQNNGYYLDPNSSSRLNRLYYVDQAYIVDLRPQYMYDWNDSAYYIDMDSSSRFNYMGRNYGWNWTEYDWNNANYYMDLNNVSELNDLRVNILYDRQNTGYYLNPNATSILNNLQVSILYDRQDTGYYVNPNSTSVLNVVYAYQFNCLSDLKLKKDIEPLGDALDKTLSLRGVRFKWDDPSMGTGDQVGLIAQDVEKVLPELVSKNEDGYLGVDYSKLSPLLIEAVRDLKMEKDREINELRQKIEAIETDGKAKEEIINDLQKRIEALETR